MKYFTKEYIKECDCEEIQRLRNQFWEYGDYASINGNEPYLVITITGQNPTNGREIFVPRSDQLDEEIIKMCKMNEVDHDIYFDYFKEKWGAMILNEFGVFVFEERNANPLIAKIKLLKELIKNELKTKK